MNQILKKLLEANPPLPLKASLPKISPMAAEINALLQKWDDEVLAPHTDSDIPQSRFLLGTPSKSTYHLEIKK